MLRRHLFPRFLKGTILFLSLPAWGEIDAAKNFLDSEIGNTSVLSRAQQEAEMQWFINAAEPFRGMSIKVASETLTTHEFEAKVLAPAFTKITGISVTHDLIGEGDVVEKLQLQMQLQLQLQFQLQLQMQLCCNFNCSCRCSSAATSIP